MMSLIHFMVGETIGTQISKAYIEVRKDHLK